MKPSSPSFCVRNWKWMGAGERSTRVVLDLMPDTHVESEQLPGSLSMARAKTNKHQNSSKLWWRRTCHISYTAKYFSMHFDMRPVPRNLGVSAAGGLGTPSLKKLYSRDGITTVRVKCATLHAAGHQSTVQTQHDKTKMT